MSSSSSSSTHHQNKPTTNQLNLPPISVTSSASVFSRMPLENVLEDLASRFIVNLPEAEKSQIERVCFQVEQAHWFYEDFVRPSSSLNLPSYHLKTFTSLFFEKCKFLSEHGAPLAGWDPKTAYEMFMRYKERVPVCGAIMFNQDASQVLLVRGFKPNSSWAFPRGKINENELPRDCAIREVLEETGFNIEPFLSLPSSNSSDDSKTSAILKSRPTNPTPSGHSHRPHGQSSTLHCEGQDHFIEITIREQRLRMYLVAGIPNDTVFATQTRQEIGSIAWFPLSDLPTFTASSKYADKQLSKMIHVSSTSAVESDGNHRSQSKFYMVVPFVNDIRTWLMTHHLIAPIPHHYPHIQTPPHIPKHVNYRYNANGFDSEAAAVHDRFSRLEAFDFFQHESAPVNHQDTRLLSASKRKKKRPQQPPPPPPPQQQQQQRKPPSKGKHHVVSHTMVDPSSSSYHSDQLVSTSDEEENHQVKNDTPWNNLEEGTRALQNFFFGSQNDDIDEQRHSSNTFDNSVLDDPSSNFIPTIDSVTRHHIPPTMISR